MNIVISGDLLLG